MKYIRIIIALLAVAFSFGSAQAETFKIQRLKQGKDPWQIMQTKHVRVLGEIYNHDTMVDNDYDDINRALVVPYGKIGHSVFFVGNSCKAISYTISFLGSSTLEVSLEPRQHRWIELKNGLYKIKVTTASGIEWWPYGMEEVNIEDAIYAGFWFDFFGMNRTTIDFAELDDYDQRTTDVMYNIVINRAIEELSSLMRLDYKTQRMLMLHFMQKIYADKKTPEEISKYADKGNIENTIRDLLEEAQSAKKAMGGEYRW